MTAKLKLSNTDTMDNSCHLPRCTATVTMRRRDYEGRTTKARAYISLKGKLSDLEDTLIALIPGGYTANPKAWTATVRRPIDEIVMPAVERVLMATEPALRNNPDFKVRWSAKAGCSCGCSPGYIIDGGLYNLDLWIDVRANDDAATADELSAELTEQGVA